MQTTAQALKTWTDHPMNPLISPPWPEFLLGDPSLVLPADSPDGFWHMFANTLLGIHHYTSFDGLRWIRQGRAFPGMRAFVHIENGVYYLFYERFTVPQFRSHVALRTSEDLWEWSEPVPLVEPSLEWEGGVSRNAGNPCLLRTGDCYRLYYSAAVVFLPDLGFCEPLNIGVAQADHITGPYEKSPEPVISPSGKEEYRNLGAGAIKVLAGEAGLPFLGFNNGIYLDSDGRTRSAILLLESDDGLKWRKLTPDPVVFPEGDGWKRALVYQLDVKRTGDELRMYYNARSGWRFGVERIGLATCKLEAEPGM